MIEIINVKRGSVMSDLANKLMHDIISATTQIIGLMLNEGIPKDDVENAIQSVLADVCVYFAKVVDDESHGIDHLKAAIENGWFSTVPVELAEKQ